MGAKILMRLSIAPINMVCVPAPEPPAMATFEVSVSFKPKK